MVNGQPTPTNRLLGILTRSHFGHFPASEFFNSHACYRQSSEPGVDFPLLRQSTGQQCSALVRNGVVNATNSFSSEYNGPSVRLHLLRVCSFGADEHDSTVSSSRYRHLRTVGIGQHQFRWHACAKQSERALANIGLHFRLTRDDRDILRR